MCAHARAGVGGYLSFILFSGGGFFAKLSVIVNFSRQKCSMLGTSDFSVH